MGRQSLSDWDVTTFRTATEGLRDRATELSDYPDRLHVQGVQPRDLLGGPKLSPEFWHWLTGSVHITHQVREEVVCALRHDVSGCTRCVGTGSYVITRDVYSRPLARALYGLARRTSKMDPHPIIILAAMLREGFSIHRAARRWSVVIVTPDQQRTEEARVLSAIRSLRNRYEETVIGRTPKWTELSESQRNAQGAA